MISALMIYETKGNYCFQSFDHLVHGTSHATQAFTLAQSGFRSISDDVIIRGTCDADRKVVTSSLAELRLEVAQSRQRPEAPLTSRDAELASQQRRHEHALPGSVREPK